MENGGESEEVAAPIKTEKAAAVAATPPKAAAQTNGDVSFEKLSRTYKKLHCKGEPHWPVVSLLHRPIEKTRTSCYFYIFMKIIRVGSIFTSANLNRFFVLNFCIVSSVH